MLKPLFVAATAMLVLGFAITTASANRLAVSGHEIYVIWHKLVFQPGSVECDVTLLGSFENLTITKNIGEQIGVVNHAEITNCVNGEAEVLAIETDPWILTYDGFTGELPNIGNVRLLLLNANINVFVNSISTACLAHTEEGNPAAGEAILNGEGTATALRADEALEIPLTGGFLCLFAQGSFEGTGTVEDGEGGPVIVTLV